MTEKKATYRKWMRNGLRLLLILLLLPFVAMGLLHLPPVQKYIAGQAAQQISKKLGTRVEIGDFDFRFPTKIALQGVRIETPQEEELIQAKEIGLELAMLRLLRQELVIRSANVHGLHAHIVTTDTSSNLQFLLDAFAPDATVPDGPTTPTRPWQINLPHAQLNVQDARVYYQDDLIGILVDAEIGDLDIQTDDVRVVQNRYTFDEVSLADSRIHYRQLSIADAEPEGPPVELEISSKRSLIQNVEALFQIDSMITHAYTLQVDVKDLESHIGKQVSVELSTAHVQADSLSYHQTNQPSIEGSFDYNHMELSQAKIDASALDYRGDSLSVRIDGMQAISHQGIELNHLQGDLYYDTQRLKLNDAQVRSSASDIRTEDVIVYFEQQMPTALSGRLSAEVAVDELRLFLPIEQQSYLQKLSDKAMIRTDANLQSDGQVMRIAQWELSAPGIELRTNGSISHPFSPQAIAANLNLDNFNVHPLRVIPDHLLPKDIRWPDQVRAQGKLGYEQDRLSFNVLATEYRYENPDFASFVQAQGYIDGVTDIENAEWFIDLDSSAISRNTLEAYLPTGTLPDDYQLPNRLFTKAKLRGTLQKLNVAIQSAAPNEGLSFSADATIESLLSPDEMRYDVNMKEVQIESSKLMTLLPDSILPAGMRLPNIAVGSGKIQQDRNGKITVDVPLQIEDAEGYLNGYLSPKDTDMELLLRNFRPSQFFENEWADTIQNYNIEPLDVRFVANGQWEGHKNLQAQLHMANEDTSSLLAAEATLLGNQYAGTLSTGHEQMRMRLSGQWLDQEIPEYSASFQIDQFNPSYWKLHPSIREFYGKGSGEFKGRSIDNSSGSIRLEDIFYQTDTSFAFVDSLVGSLVFDQRDNKATITSDLVNADLHGDFVPSKVVQEFTLFMHSHWRDSIKAFDPVIFGDKVHAEVYLHQPQFFTNGLVPNLRELSKASLELVYQDTMPELLIDLQVPRLGFQQMSVQDFHLEATGDHSIIGYDIAAQYIQFGGNFNIGKTSVNGNLHGGAIFTDIEIMADSVNGEKVDSLRHHLSFYLDPQPQSFALILSDDQIINFEQWSVPEDNLIEVSNDLDLLIDDFSLTNGKQSLEIVTQNQDDVAVMFSNFELDNIGRLFNSEEELLSGIANGELLLIHPTQNLLIASDIQIDSLHVMTAPYGDLQLTLSQPNTGIFELDADLQGFENSVSVSGSVQTMDVGKLDLNANIQALQLTILEPFVPTLLSQTQGYMQGQIAIGGTMQAPAFQGSLAPNNLSATIPLTGVTYQLEGSPIQLSGQKIQIPELILTDTIGNTGTVRGDISVHSLQLYGLDLRIVTDDLLVLNTQEGENEMYYGTIKTDANLSIGGNSDIPEIELSVTPTYGSELTYIYEGARSQHLTQLKDLMTFVPMRSWEKRLEFDRDRELPPPSPDNVFDLRANLNVNQNLGITVLMDPVTGDHFKGKAKGDLAYRQDPEGEMEMVGKIEVVEGLYDFTYENLINRTFTVKPASQLVWSGNVLNPQVDIVIYFGLETSPYPLVSAMGMLNNNEDANLRRNQYFQVAMNLEGFLEDTELTTDILYPEDRSLNKGYNTINDALASLRNDPSRLNTQAFGLVLFESFMADNQNATLVDVNASVSNILSSSLNRLAQQYIKFVEVDVGIDSYRDDSGNSNNSLRLGLRKRLLNDRLVLSIDGVSDMGGSDESAQSRTYLDNLSAEYLINQSGDLRIKVYNDRNQQVFVGGQVIRVGSRFVFTKDFDKIRF